MLSIDELNALCAEIAEETMEDEVAAMVDAIEEEELDNMMLALGPRAFGPDAGSDDCGGLFYWDLK